MCCSYTTLVLREGGVGIRCSRFVLLWSVLSTCRQFFIMRYRTTLSRAVGKSDSLRGLAGCGSLLLSTYNTDDEGWTDRDTDPSTTGDARRRPYTASTEFDGRVQTPVRRDMRWSGLCNILDCVKLFPYLACQGSSEVSSVVPAPAGVFAYSLQLPREAVRNNGRLCC